MSIGERLLLRLSRDPAGVDYPLRSSGSTPKDALRLLEAEFPDFAALVHGKRVADFGCGVGWQSIGLATEHDCAVVGIDSNPGTLARARVNARSYPVPEAKLNFVEATTPEMAGGFDVVVSQNSFEHFPDPLQVLAVMRELLAPAGILLVTFGPPWHAPYGSHMHFFTRVPWVNLLFSEPTVMSARRHFRDDGATRYEEVESGLNRMTLKKFESIVSDCDLQVAFRRDRGIRGMDWLARVPVVRELFTNRVTAILVRPS